MGSGVAFRSHGSRIRARDLGPILGTRRVGRRVLRSLRPRDNPLRPPWDPRPPHAGRGARARPTRSGAGQSRRRGRSIASRGRGAVQDAWLCHRPESIPPTHIAAMRRYIARWSRAGTCRRATRRSRTDPRSSMNRWACSSIRRLVGPGRPHRRRAGEALLRVLRELSSGPSFPVTSIGRRANSASRSWSTTVRSPRALRMAAVPGESETCARAAPPRISVSATHCSIEDGSSLTTETGSRMAIGPRRSSFTIFRADHVGDRFSCRTDRPLPGRRAMDPDPHLQVEGLPRPA